MSGWASLHNLHLTHASKDPYLPSALRFPYVWFLFGFLWSFPLITYQILR